MIVPSSGTDTALTVGIVQGQSVQETTADGRSTTAFGDIFAKLARVSERDHDDVQQAMVGFANMLPGLLQTNPTVHPVDNMDDSEADPVQSAQAIVTKLLDSEEWLDAIVTDPQLQLWLNRLDTFFRAGSSDVHEVGSLAAGWVPIDQELQPMQVEQARQLITLFSVLLHEGSGDQAVQSMANELNQSLRWLSSTESRLTTVQHANANTENQGLPLEHARSNAHDGSRISSILSFSGDKTLVDKPLMVMSTNQRNDERQIGNVQHNRTLSLQMLAHRTPWSVMALQHESSDSTGNQRQPLERMIQDQAEPIPLAMNLRDLQQAEPLIPNARPVPQATVHVQQFAEHMGRHMLNQLSMTTTNGLSEAKISLYPQHLGHVDVRITVTGGVLAAQFMAETLLGKEILEQQLPILRASLQAQGLQVDKLEVSQTNLLQFGHDHEQRHSSARQFAQQDQNNKDRNSNGFAETNLSLELSDAGETQIQDMMYGSSFNVTA